jgi:hypothetical protein
MKQAGDLIYRFPLVPTALNLSVFPLSPPTSLQHSLDHMQDIPVLTSLLCLVVSLSNLSSQA